MNDLINCPDGERHDWRQRWIEEGELSFFCTKCLRFVLGGGLVYEAHAIAAYDRTRNGGAYVGTMVAQPPDPDTAS